jgi:uncharacterized integral membrane protein
MTTIHKFKWALLSLIALFLVILVARNSGTTTVRFLGWEIEASRSILFPAFALAGFAVGVLTTLLVQRHQHQ